MSTWQALTDWILADLADNLGEDAQGTPPYVATVREDIIEKPADWAGWTLPAVCIVSADWRPRDPAHGAGGYVYDRLYEYRLIAITRGARMTAVADARAILERIETRVKGWNQSRATIDGLTTGDAVQTFGVDRGGVLIYHAQSSDPDVKFGVGGLIITARVMTR